MSVPLASVRRYSPVLVCVLGELACGGKIQTPELSATSQPPGGGLSEPSSEAIVPIVPNESVTSGSVSNDSALPRPVVSTTPSCSPPVFGEGGSGLGAANTVFRAMCVGCHSESSEDAAKPYFEGLGDLVAQGLVDPCAPDDSPFVASFREGRMPPQGAAQLSRIDLEVMEQGFPPMCEPLPLGGFFCEEAPGYPGCKIVLVETRLNRACGHCHGRNARAELYTPLGQAEIGDLASLVEGGFVVPCDADASPVVQVLRKGLVPPHATCIEFPPASTIRLTEDFIDGLCEGVPEGPDEP